MPNWCSNSVTITGDTDKVTSLGNRLKIIAKDDEMNSRMFQSLIGIPDGISLQEYNGGGWYDANVSNWGTKWDVSVDEHMCSIESDCIVLNFETAWSPPVSAFKKIAERYGVEIEMYYEEPGCDFCGKTFIDKDGDSQEEDYEYQEGIYYFEGFDEWFEREFTNNEWLVEELEDGGSALELINDNYGFLTEEEAQECAEYLEEQLQGNKQD